MRLADFYRERSPARLASSRPDQSEPGWAVVEWARVFMEAVGGNPDMLKAPLKEPLVISTACSGSGAPSHALDQLVGPKNFVERTSSEKHAATRKWFLQNHSPDHCYHDMSFARTGGFCAVHHKHCAAAPKFGEEGWAPDDVFIAGFVCKLYSQESTSRYSYNSVEEMFANPDHTSRVLPFLETSRYIKSFRPKIAILENVEGCLRKSKQIGPDDVFQAPIDFMKWGVLHGEPVGLELIPGYSMRVFRLKSSEFGLPQSRPRLYFLLLRTDAFETPTAHVFDQVQRLLDLFKVSLQDAAPDHDIWAAMKYARSVAHNYQPASGYSAASTDMSMVEGKMRAEFDRMKDFLNVSDDEYRAYTSSCRRRYGPTWGRTLCPRELEQLDLIWHGCKESTRRDMVTDVVKSIGRGVTRWDGKSPTLTTNSKIYCYRTDSCLEGPDLLALHGFNLALLDMGNNFPPTLYRLLAGNAMSVPVIGACLTAVFLCSGLRKEWLWLQPLTFTALSLGGGSSPEEEASGEEASDFD